MFDLLPDAIQAPIRTDPRLLALRLLTTSGACLAGTAARVGGEAGAALAQVLRDMAVDPTVDPVHWPIGEMVAMLQRSSARQNAEIDQLIARLSELRRRIRAMVGEVIDLLDRIDDLVAAQRQVGEIAN